MNEGYTFQDSDESDFPRPRGAEHFQRTFLSALIANGLSKMDLNCSLQGDIPLKTNLTTSLFHGHQRILHDKDEIAVGTPQSSGWVRLQVNSTVEGLQCSTDGLPVKLALTVLIAYCAIAITYVLYTSVTGIGSSSWDTIAELTTLAMNSPPSRELHNTCAGIANMDL